MVAALVGGGIALAVAVRATAHDWQPRPVRLFAAGLLAVAALTLVPATGSADPENYAAYGRMVELGHDPYTTTPHDLANIGDPVAAAVEDPWKNTTSVYGPLATAEQRFAASIGHRSVRTTVVVLVLINDLAFVLTGLLLDGRRRRRHRATASGPAVDAQPAAAVRAGVRRAPRRAGRLLRSGRRCASCRGRGLPRGCCSAARPRSSCRRWPSWPVSSGPAGTPGATLPRSRLVRLLALAIAYATVSSHALGRTLQAGKLASWATPWRAGISLLDATVGRPDSRTVMSFVAAAIAVASQLR